LLEICVNIVLDRLALFQRVGNYSAGEDGRSQGPHTPQTSALEPVVASARKSQNKAARNMMLNQAAVPERKMLDGLGHLTLVSGERWGGVFV